MPTAGSAKVKSPSQPRAQASSPTAAQRLVDEAGIGEHPAPGDAGGDQRDHLRQEQDGARRGAEGTAQVLADGRGNGEPQHDGDQREPQDEQERVADHLQQVGIGQRRSGSC